MSHKHASPSSSSDGPSELSRFLGGAFVGLTNATIVTPVANYNNHVMAQKHLAAAARFTWLRAFDGALSYNVSFIFRVSISLWLNSLFIRYLEKKYGVEKSDPMQQNSGIEAHHRMMSSVLAGGIAGGFATLPEAIAQTQQLCAIKPGFFAVAQTAYKANGIRGIFRGGFAMMGRAASLSFGFLSLMPCLSEQLKQKGLDPLVADLLAALLSGCGVSVLSTPLNNLRFAKQIQFTQLGPVPTYIELLKRQLNQGLYHGFKPRTILSVFSMFYIFKANQRLEFYSKEGFPDVLDVIAFDRDSARFKQYHP